MSYQQLTAQSVLSYLQQQPEMTEFFTDFNQLEVREIGDGNLNFVYRIKDLSSNKSVILKQAVPYVRCIGESYPLSRHRMDFEIAALLNAKHHCPEHVPEIYHYSKDQSLVVMQDLGELAILRGEIIKGKVFPLFAEHISSYMANTLFRSSDLFLSSEDKKAQVKQFVNVSLCKLTEDFVFTNAYMDHETNEYNTALAQSAIDRVQKDPAVKIAVAQMRYKFMNNAQALLHGDLHIGSIMAGPEHTYVIDPEFAFYGPMGFDVGAVIGNLYMSYFSHAYESAISGEQSVAYRQWLLETIQAIWHSFASKFKTQWLAHEAQKQDGYWRFAGAEQALSQYIDGFINELFADTIGFAACKMMRRVLGLAKVADFADIPDLEQRAAIETNIIEHATQMIVNRHNYDSIEQLNLQATRILP